MPFGIKYGLLYVSVEHLMIKWQFYILRQVLAAVEIGWLDFRVQSVKRFMVETLEENK